MLHIKKDKDHRNSNQNVGLATSGKHKIWREKKKRAQNKHNKKVKDNKVMNILDS